MTIAYPIEEIEQIKDLLIGRKETISVAESVTAGQLQAALSLAENAREFFQGGITVYNIGQKCRQLRVEPVHALEVNGVSGQVAEQMALHVAEVFCSHTGIGVTGYAAPVPEKNVGTPFALFAISMGGRIVKSQRIVGLGDTPLMNQPLYVSAIITALRDFLANA